jgi:hypothetical protein
VLILDSYILGTLTISLRFSFSVFEHYFQAESSSFNPEVGIIVGRPVSHGSADTPASIPPAHRAVKQRALGRGDGL